MVTSSTATVCARRHVAGGDQHRRLATSGAALLPPIGEHEGSHTGGTGERDADNDQQDPTPSGRCP